MKKGFQPRHILIGEHAVPACNEELLEAVVRNNQIVLTLMGKDHKKEGAG